MSRAVLAVMAGLLCTLAGMRHASALRGEAARLARWVSLLRHLTLLLREGTLSIPDALCQAAEEGHQPDALLRQLAAALRENPLCTLAEAYRALHPDETETPAVLRLLERLGQGTQESRCLAAEQAADEIGLLAERASAKAQKDARLWQTLGFLGGLCLTMLLL